MRRTLLGILSIVLLVVGLGMVIRLGIGTAVGSMCLRIGLVLGAIWLAFPQVDEISKRIPPWLIGTIALGIVIIAAAPRAFIVIAPVLVGIAIVQFIGWMFKPPKNLKRRKKPVKSKDAK